MTKLTTIPAARLRRLLTAVVAVVAILMGSVLLAGSASASSGPRPSAKALGADVVHLSWSAVSGAVKYQVRYSTSSKMKSATTVTKVNAADITTPFTNITGLKAKKTYYFQVIGVGANGLARSGWGNTSSGAKTFYSYATPTGLAPANIASTWMELGWQPVSGAPGYSIRYYNRTTGARIVWNQIETITLHGQNESDKLLKNTQYLLKVAVQQPPIGTPNTAGYTPLITMSPYSREIKVTTSNFGIAAPANLQTTQQTPSSAKVSWDAPIGVAGTMKYRVQYATNVNMSSAKSVDVAATSITLTGLGNNTTYYVRVLVVDAAGLQRSDRSAYQIAKTRVPKGTIKGSVDGAPGSDVVAMIYGTGGELVAQAPVSGAGNYAASVRPGSYKVQLSYLGTAGYTTMWAASGQAKGVPVFTQGSTLTVSGAGKTVNAPAVNLAKGASLSGTVRSGGSPLSAVYVTSLTAQTAAREVEDSMQTTGNGVYGVKGLSDGAHWVRFAKSGYSTLSILIHVSAGVVTDYRLATEPPTTRHAIKAGAAVNVNLSR